MRGCQRPTVPGSKRSVLIIVY
uniref:Uncharacterized protein n=1 Tax=Anguilla anguilla TaxID=7936 RepID=A0A0E9UER2_ANGAN